MLSALQKISKNFRASLLVCLVFVNGSQAFGGSFFSRSTHAYFHPQGQLASIGQNGEYRVFTGSTIDLGFEHNIAESGVLINPFIRYGVIGLSEDSYQESRTQTGAGIGFGFRVWRLKILTGYYNQAHRVVSTPVDTGATGLSHSRERGYFGRLGYTIYDTANLDLQFELGLQLGKIIHESPEFGDEVENTRNLTAGLSMHVGQFCGGKVLAIAAVVVAIAALCSPGNCFPNFGSGFSRGSTYGKVGESGGC